MSVRGNIFGFLGVGILASAAYAIEIQMTEEMRQAIVARIAPAGHVCVQGESCGAAGAAAGAVAVVNGEETYNNACMACHASGAGGAPVVGDVAAWEPRLAKGVDALHDSGINGVTGTAMMAKGGQAQLSDEAVIAAVDFMIENSQ
ncbi:MAG: c-type cytochrome [Pseudomonadota bacterium]